VIPNDKQRDEFKAGLEALSDEYIRQNLDVGIYGREWKRSLAEQELEQRRGATTDRWLSKSNIMAGIYAMAAIAAMGFFAWFFG